MIIDVHCHLDLMMDPKSVIERARKAGVNGVIAVSMDQGSMKKTLRLAETFRGVVEPALGIHPLTVKSNFNNKELKEALRILEENAERIIAVGEVGLDRYFLREEEVQVKQERVFRTMLDFALEIGRPVIVHAFKSESKVFSILEEYDDLKVIIHWFTGQSKLIEEGIKRRYYFSVTPAITYSNKVRRVVKRVPLEFLLSESDGPVEYRGVIGEPADCKIVVEKIAEIKKLEVDSVKKAIFENAKSLFKLS